MKRFSILSSSSVRSGKAAATTRGRPVGLATTKSCYVMIETENGGGLSAGLRMGADAMTTA